MQRRMRAGGPAGTLRLLPPDSPGPVLLTLPLTLTSFLQQTGMKPAVGQTMLWVTQGLNGTRRASLHSRAGPRDGQRRGGPCAGVTQSWGAGWEGGGAKEPCRGWPPPRGL